MLAVGEETARYLLGKLFKDQPYAQGDSLELRVFDNPAFRVVPVATPDELRERDPKARKEYVERLRQLGARDGPVAGTGKAAGPGASAPPPAAFARTAPTARAAARGG